MDGGATGRSKVPVTVYVHMDKYRTGMTYEEARDAGAIVQCDHADVTTASPGRCEVRVLDVRMVPYQEARVSRKPDDRPPWAGKRPWWQR